MYTITKHSNVFYIYQKNGEQFGFEAVEKARACKNDFGLDLFRYKGNIYEGRTGCKIMGEDDLPNFADKIQKMGGVEVFKRYVEDILKKIGESPRYTRPDVRKADIFPPSKKDENIVFVKDSYGKKHYYFRFYNENGIELYTLRNDNSFSRTIHVKCEGYMIGVGSHHNLEERLEWLSRLENGVKGEIERLFNASMADPRNLVDLGFANILGRADEAKAHNAPIIEAREQENRRRDAEREQENRRRDAEYEAGRVAEEQAAKAEYEQAIRTAEDNLLSKKEVRNSDVLGDKSLIMQLFREHKISVPLKTQGWIIKSLLAVFYNENRDCWSYRYNGNQSTVFFDYFDKLLASIKAKQ